MKENEILEKSFLISKSQSVFDVEDSKINFHQKVSFFHSRR